RGRHRVRGRAAGGVVGAVAGGAAVTTVDPVGAAATDEDLRAWCVRVGQVYHRPGRAERVLRGVRIAHGGRFRDHVVVARATVKRVRAVPAHEDIGTAVPEEGVVLVRRGVAGDEVDRVAAVHGVVARAAV